MTDKKVIPYKSLYTSRDELLVEADIHSWTGTKRKAEMQKLLIDFMRHAQDEQKGICEKCTSKLTKENIKESMFGTFIHHQCSAKRSWPWSPLKRYLKRHGVA